MQSLTTAAKALSNIIPHEHPSLKVLLAIDEASALLELPGNRSTAREWEPGDGRDSMVGLFCCALRHLPARSGVFAVVVDTSSRVANFRSPANEHDRSSRAIGIHKERPTPFTRRCTTSTLLIGWSAPIHPWTLRNWSHRSGCVTTVLHFFGLYLQGCSGGYDQADEADVNDLIDFALSKLLCVSNLEALYQD